MSEASENLLDVLAEEFVGRLRRGEHPSMTEYVARSPELAEQIHELFPVLITMEQVRPEPAASPQVMGAVRESDSPGGGRYRDQFPRWIGDYRLLREIGRGGMGIVYEAEQVSLGRHVAVKVLLPHALFDPRQVQRFQREARAAARLHHTNIVPVFGVGEHDGVHYYVMQFIHGQSLDRVLCELRALRDQGWKPSVEPSPVAARSCSEVTRTFVSPTNQQPPKPRNGTATGRENAVTDILPTAETSAVQQRSNTSLHQSGLAYWQSVARVGVQVAEALDYASKQGIQHRDIKPSNLLLDTQGTVWVADFGLAKADDSEELTQSGDIVGTLRYMAPERLHGESDLRSDLYSLGATLFELLTLRPLYVDTDRVRLAREITEHEPPSPRGLIPNLPLDLETVILKSTAKSPRDRYQTAAEMAADLRRFLEDKPITARRAGRIERARRWCRRNQKVAVLTASVVLLLVAVTVISTVAAFWLKNERDASRRAESNAKKAETTALRANAEQSKAEAGRRRELSRSYLNEAKFFRFSGKSGQRLDGLNRIERIIATLKPDELDYETRAELRGAAISHLALPDVRRIASFSVPRFKGDVQVHPSFEFFAHSNPDGPGIVIRKMDDPSFSILLGGDRQNTRDQGQFPPLRVFSPSGRWLAEVRQSEQDGSKLLSVWDWRERKQVCQDRTVTNSRPAFHPNDRELVFEGAWGVNVTLDVFSDTILSESPRTQHRDTLTAYSADGELLAICSEVTTSLVVDQKTWEPQIRFWELPRVTSAVWHPTQPKLVLCNADGACYLWDYAKRTGRFMPVPWIGAIQFAGFSSDGRYFARSGANSVIEIRQFESDKSLIQLAGQFLRFQSGALRFATLSTAGDLEIWEFVESRSLVHVNQSCRAVTFSPDSRWLATAGNLGTQIYETRTWKRVADLGLDECGPVTFHPDGTELVTFGMFTHAQRWPITETNSAGTTWRLGPPQSLVQRPSMPAQLIGFKLAPQHFGRTSAISAYGQMTVLADARHDKILINDPQHLETIREFESGVFHFLRGIAITPDGKWIAAGSDGEKHVGVFDSATAKQVLHFTQHGNVVFSPDGHYLATSSPLELRLYRV
jgi:serine/threonine protein kinase/WD40 repeat protein